jgi:translation initiation factor IF-2
MSKIRVYELAKELGISSKDLITLLQEEFNIEVKNHMSVIEDEDAELIKELLMDKKEPVEVKSEISEDTDKKGIVLEYEEMVNEQVAKSKKSRNKNKKNNMYDEIDNTVNTVETDGDGPIIEIGNTITVKELAEKLEKPITEVIKQLIFNGVMAAINQEIDFKTAEKVAVKFEAKLLLKEETAGQLEDDTEIEENIDTEKRPPVVTVMGHVDHGKTSLLDAIRKAKVTESEAGGITQHIGAYTVMINDEKITFLDTPGHEAFTAMRARGAQITDIVILVVAADDGIMPQTREAINHCKAANVPMIVAVNKMDKPDANLDRVKQELTEYALIAEDWGGDTVVVPVSARTREGIDELLEMVILTSEMLELKADSTRKAKGTVVEAQLDKGRGPVATLLVQNGTLNVGDSILVGTTYGRIRAMFDDKGKKIKSAGPSIPVAVLGLSEVPAAGDRFNVVKDEKTARDMAENRMVKMKDDHMHTTNRVSLEDLYSQIQEGKVKELGVIVKADVQGSVEAINGSLEKLSTESVKVRVLHGGVGAITETDVILADASNAIIIGFNVRPDGNASALADKKKVEIKSYRIIYDAIEDIKSAMIGMLEPDFKEVVQGRAEIRQIYKISSVGTIAGSYVLDGKITRNSDVRVIRDGIVIFESKFASLKRFKDDVREVNTGYECGLSVEKFNDLKEGDIIEAYTMQEIKRQEL